MTTMDSGLPRWPPCSNNRSPTPSRQCLLDSQEAPPQWHPHEEPKDIAKAAKEARVAVGHRPKPRCSLPSKPNPRSSNSSSPEASQKATRAAKEPADPRSSEVTA